MQRTRIPGIKTVVVEQRTAQLLKALGTSRPLLLAALLIAAPACMQAQISLASAVDLALRNSPRVRSAQAQVTRARAELAETHDVYIPSVSGGADLGEAFGYSPYPPTLFSINATSLVFNLSQHDYIRSSRAGLQAAQFALQDAREAVAEDAALAFIAVDHDQQQAEALTQQFDYANHLVEIVQQRKDAGYDAQGDLLQAQITAQQIKVNLIHLQGTTATDRHHLATLLGVPVDTLRADGGFPDQDFPDLATIAPDGVRTPAIDAAFSTARAKQQQAFGDSRFLYRPQVNLIVQYSHYATFASAFHQLKSLYSNISNDEQAYAVQITIPILDRARSARARETAADAVKAYNDASNTQMQVFEGQFKLRQSLAELQARTQLASLEQQFSQQQLAAIHAQLTASIGSGPAITPKDEQNALINERARYLSVIDTTYQLRQSEINLLRQTGRLEEWLRNVAGAPANTLPPAPAPVLSHP